MTQPVPVPAELIQFIREGTKFIIAGHEEPDGDCIGSQLTLCSLLARMGKTAIPCSAGPFRRTEVAPYAKNFRTAPADSDKAGARLILVDCSEYSRSGDLEPHLKGLPAAIIDHHASGSERPPPEGTVIFQDPAAPSVTFMIYSLIKALGMELTKEEARLLLFGLCTDTGFFRHTDENSENTFMCAAGLIKAGASPKQTYQAIYGGRSFNSRLLLGRILSRSQTHFNGRLIITHENSDDISELGIESRDSDILYQLLQSVAGTEAIAYIRQEKPDECSLGLRSRDWVNVAAIAESLGGGGHRNAAGCTVTGDIGLATKMVLDKFSRIFA